MNLARRFRPTHELHLDMSDQRSRERSVARRDRQSAIQRGPISGPLAAQQRHQPASPATLLATRSQQRLWRQIFLSNMQTSSGTWASLLTSPEDTATAALGSHIRCLLAAHPHLPPPTRESDYISWALTVATGNGSALSPTAPSIVIHAIGIRKRDASHRRQGWRRLAASVHLYKSPAYLGAFAATLAVLWVDPLPASAPYPPPRYWIAESQETFATWDRYFDNAPLADKRKKRQPIHLLAEEKLQLVIPAGLSCLLRDRKSGSLFCVVIRDFCPNPDILRWARRSISAAVSVRKSSRVRGSNSSVGHGASRLNTCCSSKILEQTSRSALQQGRAASPFLDGRATY